MVKNYYFVDFPKKPDTNYITDPEKRYGGYSGVILLELEAVDDLYLGSGFIRYDPHTGLIAETLAEEKQLIIPGSSIKGALRQVARAVSDSCIPYEHNLQVDPKHNARCNVKKDSFNVCITCNIFGAMGLSSKIICSDFVTYAKGNTYIADVPMQYSPNISSPNYKDDGHHIGYKFYLTNCKKRTDRNGAPVKTDQHIEAVKRKTVFSGEIRFSKLSEKELALLMYSLGLANDFSHKLGGYRADGMGTVNFSCIEFILNGKKCEDGKAEEFARRYIEDNLGRVDCSDDCYYRITRLREIMKHKKGGV